MEAPLSRRLRIPFRWHLLVLVTGTLFPLVAFAAVAVFMVETRDRASDERRLQQSSRTLAAAVEREVAASVRTLQVMAESERLDSDDLLDFHIEVERALASQTTWRGITLLAPDGQELVDTEYAHGEALPIASEPESVRRVAELKQPAVGYLVKAGRSNEWTFPIRVPVLRGGELRYILSAYITPQAMLQVVGSEPFPDEWTRSVADQRGTIVARSRRPDEFIGKNVTSEFQARVHGAKEFLIRTTSREGIDVYTAASPVPMIGWVASIAVPVEFLDGPLRRSLFGLAGSGLFLLFASSLGAFFLSRRVSRGIVVATSAAKALAHGELLAVPPTSIEEVAELGDALARSAELLARRERERDENLSQAEAARAQAEAARVQAEAANREKDEFLAMLAHEIRNPLSPIVAAIELLMRKGEARSREHGIISRQVQHLVRIVDDLLDVSRITRGKIDLRRAPIELAVVVARAREMAQPLVDQRRHSLTIDVPEAGLALDADPVRLAQVLANLLTNAAKYTDLGGEIRLSASRKGDEVVIEITDNGQGISPELLPRIFDLFVQAPRSLDRQQGGLGIGLTLVRSLVQMHGGRVEASSDGLERGSTFTIWLPLLPSSSQEIKPKPALAVAPSALVRGRRLRILIVDDNVDAATLLAELFSDQAHEIEIAYDGSAALAAVERFVPDVAILDIGLPVIDGFTLATLMRDKLGRSAPIFVAVTGYGREQDRIRSREAGFVRHFVKPVDPAAILSAVAELASVPTRAAC